MEEILASIRRIIADDDAKPLPPAAPASPQARQAAVVPSPPSTRDELNKAPSTAEKKEMRDLSEATRAEGLRTIEGRPDVMFDERAAERVAAMTAPDDRMLLSNATSAAVDSAFNTLAHTILVQNARTLEDLVREMLRPLLKNWLDDNLPKLVERLVRAEIERLTRGR